MSAELVPEFDFAGAVVVTDAEREVLRVDAQRVQALLDNDLQALGQLLADELHYVHTNGALDSKESMLRDLSSGARRYLEMDDLVVRVGSTAPAGGADPDATSYLERALFISPPC